MPEFHPEDNLLVEYSAGSLAWGQAILLKAHLNYCPQCRHKIHQCDSLGAAFIEEATPQPLAPGSLQNIMAKIHQASSPQTIAPIRQRTDVPQTAAPTVRNRAYSDATLANLPNVVKKLLPGEHRLHWKTISPSLKEATLHTGQHTYQISVHKIKRGGKVVEHDHRGLELTLVLSGSFSDEKGVYHVGDFLTREPGQVHRPMAAQDQDCVCLSLQEAPVKLTGFMGKLVNPFLSVTPS